MYSKNNTNVGIYIPYMDGIVCLSNPFLQDAGEVQDDVMLLSPLSPSLARPETQWIPWLFTQQ